MENNVNIDSLPWLNRFKWMKMNLYLLFKVYRKPTHTDKLTLIDHMLPSANNLYRWQHLLTTFKDASIC